MHCAKFSNKHTDRQTGSRSKTQEGQEKEGGCSVALRAALGHMCTIGRRRLPRQSQTAPLLAPIAGASHNAAAVKQGSGSSEGHQLCPPASSPEPADTTPEIQPVWLPVRGDHADSNTGFFLRQLLRCLCTHSYSQGMTALTRSLQASLKPVLCKEHRCSTHWTFEGSPTHLAEQWAEPASQAPRLSDCRCRRGILQPLCTRVRG